MGLDAVKKCRLTPISHYPYFPRRLHRGDAAQKVLAFQLGRFVDTGYACVYHQPPGAEWA